MHSQLPDRREGRSTVSGPLVRVVSALAALIAGGASGALADSPVTAFFTISEIRIGALDHDTTGLWSGFSRERAGVDANLEVLLGPLARTFGGILRPAVGATLNTSGQTSKAYADLRWERESASGFFFALGMGVAVHNGEVELVDENRKALGSHVLFHPSTELGYRFDGINSISIFADHMSNGFSQRYNEGMDTVGVRYGRRLGVLPAPIIDRQTALADFAGPYAGAFAGYQLGRADWEAARTGGVDTNGLAAGGFAGISWQSGSGLFGIEADAVPTATGSTAACFPPATTCRVDVSALYSIRTRFGWIWGSTMVYGTGGLTIATLDAVAANAATGQTAHAAETVNYGVAVGAGLEHKLTSHLAIRAEAIHYGLPTESIFLQDNGVATVHFQSTVGRIGLAWYLN